MGMIGKALAGLGKGMVQASLIQLESNAQEMRMKRLAEFEGTIAGKAASAKHTLEREDKYIDTAVEEAYKTNAAAQKHEFDKELEGIKQKGDRSKLFGKVELLNGQIVDESDIRSEYSTTYGKMNEFGVLVDASEGAPTFEEYRNQIVKPQFRRSFAEKAESDMDAPPTQAELDRAAAELNTVGGKNRGGDFIPFNEASKDEILAQVYRNRGGNVPRGTSQQPKAQQSATEKTQTQQFKPDLSAPRGTDRNPHVPQSEAEYQAIKPGETYIDPDDGKGYRKPQQAQQSATEKTQTKPTADESVGKLRTQESIDIDLMKPEPRSPGYGKTTFEGATKKILDLKPSYDKVEGLINKNILPENIQEVKDAIRFAEVNGNKSMVEILKAVLKRLDKGIVSNQMKPQGKTGIVGRQMTPEQSQKRLGEK